MHATGVLSPYITLPMTSTILLVGVLWLLWRFIATPATTTADAIRATAYRLAPTAAFLGTISALLRAPWRAQQQWILQALAGTTEASPEAVLELAYAPINQPSMAVAPPPLEAMSVKQLRAFARLQGYRGQLISRGKRADLIATLSHGPHGH